MCIRDSTYGQAITDVVVIIQNGPQSHVDIGMLTDKDGVFKLIDLVPGDYNLLFRKEGFALKAIQTTTNSSTEYHLIVKLEHQED